MAQHAPGWNDPPPMSFSEIVAPKRTLLNKRVSYPLSSGQDNVQTANSLAGAFSFAFSNPIPFSPIPDLIRNLGEKQPAKILRENDGELRESLIAQNVSESEMLPFVVSVFDEIVSSIPFGSEKKLDDIKSRLIIFKDMWENKLGSVVKEKMYRLAKDLSDGKYDSAYALHCALIAEHITEVSQWMVAVKHIIHISRTSTKDAKPICEEIRANCEQLAEKTE